MRNLDSNYKRLLTSFLAILITGFVFIIPFLFIIVNASKTKREAAKRSFSWPTESQFFDNLVAVIQAKDYMLITAFINSILLTVLSVTILIVLSSMAAFILERKNSDSASKFNNVISFFILAGLMMPAAVVPTIWVLQSLGLFKTLSGLVFIEVAYGLSFSILLYRAFIRTIPRELDEAAIMDGAKSWRLFFKVIFPLLKPVTITNIVVQSVTIFNDFVNPLYYLPGKDNVTVQLTLYNFQSSYETSYNLLLMNVLIITIPPLIMFVFFNKQIVTGMTAGAVKG